MRCRRSIVAALVLVASLIATREADAQSHEPLQVGAGYVLLHESIDGGGQTFPAGVYVDIEQTLSADEVKSWGWMGQFEGSFRSDSGFSEQLYTALGGIRVSTTKPLRWVPSGFGLIGVGVLNSSCDTFCVGTKNAVAFQGGLAVSTRLTDSTLIDIAFKATKLKAGGGGIFNVAIAGGVRFRLGR